MPAAVSETGVRAPAQAPATGIRPHSGADQASSPFSELLDLGVASEAGTPLETAAADPAVAGNAGAEAAVLGPKAQKPEVAAPEAKTKTAGQVEAELALAIVAAVEGPAEKAAQPVTAAVIPADGSPAETKPETDEPPAQTETPDTADAPAAVQAAPVIDALAPAPAPLPALGEAAAVVPGTDDPVVAAAATAQPATTPATPAVKADIPGLSAPIADKTAAPAAGVAVTVAAKAAAPVASDSEPAPAKRPAGKSAPRVDVATGVKAEAANGKAVATPEKSPEKTAADAQPVNDVASTAPRSNRSSDAAANAPSRNIETPAAAQTLTAAEAAPDTAANTNALPAPVLTATSATQVAQAPHQAAARDGIPVAGLAVEIAAHAQAGKNHFEIRLDPPELGRIEVRLHVDGDGQVTSHVRVERAETLDLLRRDAPQLERALQQAGLKTFDGGMQFSLRDQSFAQRDQSQTMPQPARIVVPDETLATIETQRSYGRLAGLGSGVDIRV